MKFLQMKYFHTVCKYNNITKAAEELFVSQPAVSASIRDLEKQLGVKLFNRINNRLTLTAEGKLFFEESIDILESTEKLERMMQDLGNRHHRIVVGVPPMIGVFLFANIFNEFMNLHTDSSIELIESGSLDVRRHLLENRVDVALGVIDESISAKIIKHPIVETSLVVAVSKNHHLANRKSLSLKDLKNEKIILMKSDSYQYQSINNKFEALGINPDIFLYSSQSHTILQFLKNGNCVAFLFKDVADMEADIVSIPLTPYEPITIGLIWKNSDILFSDTMKLIDFIKRRYSQ